MGIFSTGGVLGRDGDDLTPELFERIGRAYVKTLRHLITAERLTDHDPKLVDSELDTLTNQIVSSEQANERRFGHSLRPKVMVGGDARLSTPLLKNALVKGLQLERCVLYNLGSLPTPALRFAMNRAQVDGGLMVTASTQAYDYNGIKFFRHGRPMTRIELQLLQSDLAEVERSAQSMPYDGGLYHTRDSAIGRNDTIYLDVINDYCTELLSKVEIPRPVKVVIDGSNGVAGDLLANILEQLCCTVERLNIEPNGKFEYHPPDPNDIRNLDVLINRVKATGAELGLCIDSDGTNLGLVMEGGHPISSNFFVFYASDEPVDPGEAEDALLAGLRCVEAISHHHDAIRALLVHLP